MARRAGPGAEGAGAGDAEAGDAEAEGRAAEDAAAGDGTASDGWTRWSGRRTEVMTGLSVRRVRGTRYDGHGGRGVLDQELTGIHDPRPRPPPADRGVPGPDTAPHFSAASRTLDP
ncbi:hypothetical protein GCM10010349_47420 [Streptomyces flavofungini]|nr:hypothetical protein GCM10010349_47420 [Streptomyces flavofungini]